MGVDRYISGAYILILHLTILQSTLQSQIVSSGGPGLPRHWPNGEPIGAADYKDLDALDGSLVAIWSAGKRTRLELICKPFIAPFLLGRQVLESHFNLFC